MQSYKESILLYVRHYYREVKHNSPFLAQFSIGSRTFELGLRPVRDPERSRMHVLPTFGRALPTNHGASAANWRMQHRLPALSAVNPAS